MKLSIIAIRDKSHIFAKINIVCQSFILQTDAEQFTWLE